MTVRVTPPSSSAATTSAVVVSNLRRAYGSRIVIDKLNLRIERGEFVALLGESGCGKTTLLRALAGLDPIQGGRISAPRRPAVVFQEHRLLPRDSLCSRPTRKGGCGARRGWARRPAR
jgi:sulfonate transport system ATP-binding protein